MDKSFFQETLEMLELRWEIDGKIFEITSGME